ncbi:MAG: hypothetical protein ACOC4G_06040 [Bacillota bacterium]
MTNFFQGSLIKKIVFGVVILVLIWILWSIFGGENRETREILELPDGQIEIVNEDGDELTLEVKMGSSAVNLSGVNPKVIEETVIYITSRYPASAARTYGDIKADIEVAFFGPDRTILSIHEIPEEESQTITPEQKYQHVLIAPAGLFKDKDISVENGSKIK